MTDQRKQFEEWFASQQGIAYDGMWSFAWAAWQAAASQYQPAEHDVADQISKWMWNTFKNSAYSFAAFMTAVVISITCFGVFIAQAVSVALRTRGGEG